MSVLTVIILTVGCLTGCSHPLTIDDAYKSLQEAIVETRTKTEFYTKVSYYANSGEAETISYQVIPNDEETEKNELRAKFMHSYQVSTYAPADKQYYEFGYSKSKDINDKNAKPEDYKPYQFVTIGEKDTVATATTMDVFETTTIDNVYNVNTNTKGSLVFTDMTPTALVEELSTISRENVVDADSKAARQGVNDKLTLKIIKEGSIYNGLTLDIVILYGKVSTIEYKTSDATVKIAIVYASPKINTPAYDKDGIIIK